VRPLTAKAAVFVARNSPFAPLVARDKGVKLGLFSMPNVLTPQDLVVAAQTALARWVALSGNAVTSCAVTHPAL
jgi:hypothetical protein